jgi:hypothetical protein
MKNRLPRKLKKAIKKEVDFTLLDDYSYSRFDNFYPKLPENFLNDAKMVARHRFVGKQVTDK